MKQLRTARLVLAVFFLLDGCATLGVKEAGPQAYFGRVQSVANPEKSATYAAQLARAPHGPEAARALYFLGTESFQAGRSAEAALYFEKSHNEGKGSGWDLCSDFMSAQIKERSGDLTGAFAGYQRLLGSSLDGPEAPVEKECLRLIANLDATQVQALIASDTAQRFFPALLLRRITLLVEAKKSDEAYAAIDEYRRSFPGLQGPELDRLALEADRAFPVDVHTLGLLLPLKGPQAAFALQARQGAELALEEANLGVPEAGRLSLAVEDEGSNTGEAMAALKRLVGDRQVLAVLGPMSSDASLALLPFAASRRTVLLSPSAIRADLGNASPYFFRNSLTPEKQAVAMAEYAAHSLKVTRVAGLYPDSAYGSTLMQFFEARFAESGGVVAASLSYPAGTNDFLAVAIQLGGADPGLMKEADAEEKRDQQAKVEAASTRLGRVLLASPLEAAPQPSTPATKTLAPVAPTIKVAVVDFGCSTAAAQINAGRAFSDRFWRVLGQLNQLRLVSPDETADLMRDKGWNIQAMEDSPSFAVGRFFGADFVVTGTVVELLPPATQPVSPRFEANQVFRVTVRLLDVKHGTLATSQQFEMLKMKPPKANSMGLQAFYLPGPASEVLQAASALTFCDMKLPLLGSDLMERPQVLKTDDQGVLEGARFSTGFFADSADPKVKRFVEAYKKRFAAAPTLQAANAYDATSMLAAVAKSGVLSREEMRRGLLKIKDFEGVTGSTSFDGRQDAAKRIPILKVNSLNKTLEQVN